MLQEFAFYGSGSCSGSRVCVLLAPAPALPLGLVFSGSGFVPGSCSGYGSGSRDRILATLAPDPTKILRLRLQIKYGQIPDLNALKVGTFTVYCMARHVVSNKAF